MGFESQFNTIAAERPKRDVAVQFERKSFEDLTSKGAERVEAMKETFVNVRDSIKNKAVGLWSRIKQGAKSAAESTLSIPEITASLPEIVSYGYEAGKAKLQEGYQTAADFVEGKVAETRFSINKGYLSSVDRAKEAYNGLENRALDVVSGFSQKISEIGERTRNSVEAYRGDANSERRAEQMEIYQSLLEKARELGLVVTVEVADEEMQTA